MKEYGFRPLLCTYRLNWARRTSWGWWDDTPLQTQNSRFESRRSEVEHATSRSRKLDTILNLYAWTGKKHFVSLKLEGESGVQTSDLRLSKQAVLTAAPEFVNVFYETQWRQRKPFWMGTRWKQSYIRHPPPYFIVLASLVTIMEVKAIEFHSIQATLQYLNIYCLALEWFSDVVWHIIDGAVRSDMPCSASASIIVLWPQITKCP